MGFGGKIRKGYKHKMNSMDYFVCDEKGDKTRKDVVFAVKEFIFCMAQGLKNEKVKTNQKLIDICYNIL